MTAKTPGLVTRDVALIAEVRNAALEALHTAGEFVVRATDQVIPYDFDKPASEKHMVDTAQVTPKMFGVIPVVEVSYNTPYALVQHENEEYTHAPGRKHHYLTETVAANEEQIREILAAGLRTVK